MLCSIAFPLLLLRRLFLNLFGQKNVDGKGWSALLKHLQLISFALMDYAIKI